MWLWRCRIYDTENQTGVNLTEFNESPIIMIAPIRLLSNVIKRNEHFIAHTQIRKRTESFLNFCRTNQALIATHFNLVAIVIPLSFYVPHSIRVHLRDVSESVFKCSQAIKRNNPSGKKFDDFILFVVWNFSWFVRYFFTRAICISMYRLASLVPTLQQGMRKQTGRAAQINSSFFFLFDSFTIFHGWKPARHFFIHHNEHSVKINAFKINRVVNLL